MRLIFILLNFAVISFSHADTKPDFTDIELRLELPTAKMREVAMMELLSTKERVPLHLIKMALHDVSRKVQKMGAEILARQQRIGSTAESRADFLLVMEVLYIDDLEIKRMGRDMLYNRILRHDHLAEQFMHDMSAGNFIGFAEDARSINPYLRRMCVELLLPAKIEKPVKTQ